MDSKIISTIKEHIKQDNLDLALEEMQDLSKKSPHECLVMNLLGQSNAFKQAKIKGIISFEQLSKGRNQLRESVIELLKLMENPKMSNTTNLKYNGTRNRTGGVKWGNISFTRKSNVRFF